MEEYFREKDDEHQSSNDERIKVTHERYSLLSTTRYISITEQTDIFTFHYFNT